MKLPSPPMALELLDDLVDAVGDDEHWAVGGLRQKVPQRPVETPRQHDPFAFLCNQRKGAFNAEHCVDVAREQPAPSLGLIGRPEPLGIVRDQVDDAGYSQVLGHASNYPASRAPATVPMALPRDGLQIPLSPNARDYVRGTLIALAAIPISAVLWGLFTGRWTAESRRNRKLNRDEAAVSPMMRVPPPWLFILTYLLGVAIQRAVPLGIISPERASLIRVFGFVLVVAGIAFAASALGIFKKANTTTVPFEKPSSLVISGPYRFTRNPMYVGLTLLYLGVAGTRTEIWPVIVLPLMLAYVNFVVIPVEERNLAGVFGESYDQYRAKVRRWL